jgi:hypothetical protein
MEIDLAIIMVATRLPEVEMGLKMVSKANFLSRQLLFIYDLTSS